MEKFIVNLNEWLADAKTKTHLLWYENVNYQNKNTWAMSMNPQMLPKLIIATKMQSFKPLNQIFNNFMIVSD